MSYIQTKCMPLFITLQTTENFKYNDQYRLISYSW